MVDRNEGLQQEIGDGFTALDAKAARDRMDGFAVASGLGVTVDNGLTLTVAAGTATIGRSGGSTQTVGLGSASNVTLASADTVDPRKDTIYLDTAGSVQVETGDPEPAQPAGNDREDTFAPVPPVPSTEGVILAEVWVGAGAASLSGEDVRDRRQPAEVTADSAAFQSVSTDEQSFTDADIIVSPATHDFDDIVTELNAGKHVFAMGGDYPASESRHYITDGSLTMADSGQIVVPDIPAGSWLDFDGTSGDTTAITADVDKWDAVISVNDTSGFSSGNPALINDDSTYFEGQSNGEIVLIEEVVDGTTLRLADGAYLPHSTTDTITIEPVDPITGTWKGVTFDCKTTDQTVNGHPLIQVDRSYRLLFEDIEFINSVDSEMHQYFEFRGSIYSKLKNVSTGEVDDGNLGLLVQPESRTKFVQIEDCQVHYGRVSEFGNDGPGPSQHARFDTVDSWGGQAVINDTAIRPEFRNCEFSNVYDAVRNNGKGTRFVNCHVRGDGPSGDSARHGFVLQGVGEEVINCSVENMSRGIDVRIGSHPDSGTEGKHVEDFVSRDSTIMVKSNDAVPTTVNGYKSIGDEYVYQGTSGAEATFRDGQIAKTAATRPGVFQMSGCDSLTIKDTEADLGGNDTFLVRETNGAGKLVCEGVTAYDGQNAMIRVTNTPEVRLSDVFVPQDKASVQYVFRNVAGGNVLILNSVDGRNSSVSAFRLDGTFTTHIDGTTLNESGSNAT